MLDPADGDESIGLAGDEPLVRVCFQLRVGTVLDTALITAPAKRDPELVKKLDAVAGQAFEQSASILRQRDRAGGGQGDRDEPAKN